MALHIVLKLTAEAQELARKYAELRALEAQVAEQEGILAEYDRGLKIFEAEYMRIVGQRYLLLKRWEARFTDQLPTPQPEGLLKTPPPARLKECYRALARQIHPDLVTDPVERARRTQVMAEANAAYTSGDEVKLQQMLQQWAQPPKDPIADNLEAERARVTQRIITLQDRLQAIPEEILQIKQLPLYKLMLSALDAKIEGRDLLAETGFLLDKQIRAIQKRWHQ